MTPEDTGSDALRTHRALAESLSVPAALWDHRNSLVAGSPAARGWWQGNLPEPQSGFAVTRELNGAVWKGWPDGPDPAAGGPRVRFGERADGSRVEFLSFPSIVRDPTGRTAGILEIFVPLTAETVPRSMLHDLSNVIGVVLGNADLALTELSRADEAAENLTEIRLAALRAREIVRGADSRIVRPVPETPNPRIRVLWIDDDEAFLLLASRSLLRMGCDVRTFPCPDEAFAVYQQDVGYWDLVVIDNNLLGREGLDVARQILRQNAAQRICIASGAVDEDLQTRARQEGVCRVIAKPATPAEFAHALEDVLAPPTRPPSPP